MVQAIFGIGSESENVVSELVGARGGVAAGDTAPVIFDVQVRDCINRAAMSLTLMEGGSPR